jgi:hypothetical protein
MTKDDVTPFRWKCPACGYVVTAAACDFAPGAKPRPGDLNVCMNCVEVFVFDDQGGARPITRAEYIALDAEERGELEATSAALRKAIDVDLALEQKLHPEKYRDEPNWDK